MLYSSTKVNLSLMKIYQTVTVMGVKRLQDALTLRFSAWPAKVIISIITKISILLPLFLIRFIPKSLSTLFASSAGVNNCSQNRCFHWADRAAQSTFIGHRKAAFYVKCNYIYKAFEANEAHNFIIKELLQDFKNEENLGFYSVWSWHNNSQKNHISLVNSIISNLKQNDYLFNPDLPHYLPEHTTNMGHLGALFLYANFYRKVEVNREIAIWPALSPNKYYLNELIKIFPLKIKLLNGAPLGLSLSKNQIDTLSYSRLGHGKWRYESLSDIPANQEFPEYFIEQDFKLNSSAQLDNHASIELPKIGFRIDKWYVCLHVKENELGYSKDSETRDASIETYFTACELIRELGGQVVRMGGGNFPKLSNNFPAIDYAHTNIKSDKLDYWLWANCKFWLGTLNGAAVAVIPFGKPRLVTNTWPINPIGPSTDFFLPKLAYDVKRKMLLSPEEIVNHKLSRSMKKNLFFNNGLKLIDNSPELLRSATGELNCAIDSQSKYLYTYKEYENKIYSSMLTPINTPKMHIPLSYKEHIEKTISII
jgi:putative glycosyltransferase (TIGR04372 family)